MRLRVADLEATVINLNSAAAIANANENMEISRPVDASGLSDSRNQNNNNDNNNNIGLGDLPKVEGLQSYNPSGRQDQVTVFWNSPSGLPSNLVITDYVIEVWKFGDSGRNQRVQSFTTMGRDKLLRSERVILSGFKRLFDEIIFL